MKTKQTKQFIPGSNRLGGYLAASVTLGTLASSANAAIVMLDVSLLSGPNANVPADDTQFVNLALLHPGLGVTGFLVVANSKMVYDSVDGWISYHGIGGAFMDFAVTGGPASPQNFQLNDAINNAAGFSNSSKETVFRFVNPYESPDFGPGSYMGFTVPEIVSSNPTGNVNYGWLEVTWDSLTGTFEILSGAYESDFNTPILAGDTGGSSIPEPASSLSTLGLLASGMMIRRRRKKAA